MKKLKELTFIGVLGAVALLATPQQSSALDWIDCHSEGEGPIFLDVCFDDPHSSAIRDMKNRGVITGYSNDHYYPMDPIVRGQVATMFTRAFDLDVPDTVSRDLYTDVRAHHHYAPVISAVMDAGIMVGRFNNTVFDPSANISRQQMATTLIRVLEMNGVEIVEGNMDDVTDIEDAYESHRENIAALNAYGITQTTDGAFRPQDSVTRAQMASFFERTFAVLVTETMGFESLEMIDPNTFHLHFSRDISDKEWSRHDIGFGPTPESVEVVGPTTLEIKIETALNYDRQLRVHYKGERTTISYQREPSALTNLEIDTSGGQITISGEIPGAPDDTNFYIDIHYGDGRGSAVHADETTGLRLEDGKFTAHFPDMEPGEYWVLIDARPNYGSEEIDVVVD
ncbi:hypothetical protein DH09_13900 [Bacillaceae bacterium JMAK1]|nr:hypothetical protein DH09_13900 [Bacillaceae bacterium JMAK1]